MGKTNVLDAIYYLSFTKSAFNSIDSANITHGEDLSMIKGHYNDDLDISCGLRRGTKKQFRKGPKDYKRLIDHIGLIPLVMVSPQDAGLVIEGSEERRRFMDSVISQYDRTYLEHLTDYAGLLKQRNALLKEEGQTPENELFDILEAQMAPHAEYIYAQRTSFVEKFIPLFQEFYAIISGGKEHVSLRYTSQLQERELLSAFFRTRGRDLILGWTSQGVHKDDLEMMLGDYPLKQVGSQGQQKTYLIALKLAQATFLSNTTSEGMCEKMPILLLDDIFDKLDAERVEKIVELVSGQQFGQIFITDTDRQHLVEILHRQDAKVFIVENGTIIVENGNEHNTNNQKTEI